MTCHFLAHHFFTVCSSVYGYVHPHFHSIRYSLSFCECSGGFGIFFYIDDVANHFGSFIKNSCVSLPLIFFNRRSSIPIHIHLCVHSFVYVQYRFLYLFFFFFAQEEFAQLSVKCALETALWLTFYLCSALENEK